MTSETRNIAAGGRTPPAWGPPEKAAIPDFRPINHQAENTLDVYMIWATDPADPSGMIWLVDAWDADTVDDNKTGWDEAVDKARKLHGVGNVRVTVTSINCGALEQSFNPVRV